MRKYFLIIIFIFFGHNSLADELNPHNIINLFPICEIPSSLGQICKYKFADREPSNFLEVCCSENASVKFEDNNVEIISNGDWLYKFYITNLANNIFQIRFLDKAMNGGSYDTVTTFNAKIVNGRLSLLDNDEITNDNCFTQFSDTNICEFAKKVQKELAPNLPMQLSQNLIIRSVSAVGPELGANAVLKYTEQYLNEQLAVAGRSRDSVDSQMKQMTINMVCSSAGLEAFVGLGGTIVYQYNFVDGNKYLEIIVTADDC